MLCLAEKQRTNIQSSEQTLLYKTTVIRCNTQPFNKTAIRPLMSESPVLLYVWKRV
jgi:hypothetical protein